MILLYQRSWRWRYCGPATVADRGNGFGHPCEQDSRVTAGFDDFLIVFRGMVRDKDLVSLLPDLLERGQFWQSGRNKHDQNVGGDTECLRRVQAGLVRAAKPRRPVPTARPTSLGSAKNVRTVGDPSTVGLVQQLLGRIVGCKGTSTCTVGLMGHLVRSLARPSNIACWQFPLLIRLSKRVA